MEAKPLAQQVTELIHELDNLNKQSRLIREEIQSHITFDRIHQHYGAIKQQLEFIRSHLLPHSSTQRIKLIKHNKLALRLIAKHLADIDLLVEESQLSKLHEEEEAWAAIEEQREQTRHELEMLESLNEQIALDQEANEAADKETALFETEVAALSEKMDDLLKELEAHRHGESTIYEEIHHLHNELQFVRLHADSHFLGHHEAAHSPSLLGHHFESTQHVNEHFQHLYHHWDHLIEELHHEQQESAELDHLREEIRHTKELLEEKLDEIEQEKLHYMQYPGAHIVPVKIDKDKK